MMNILQKILGALVLIFIQNIGMEKPPKKDDNEDKQSLQRRTNPNLFLGLLPVPLVRSFAPLFSTPGPEEGLTNDCVEIRPRDNRQDAVVEASKNMRQFDQVFREQFGQDSLDDAAYKEFSEAQRAFLAGHPEEKSSFSPNIISTTAALDTQNARRFLSEIVTQNIATFRSRPQAEKNKTAMDCLRCYPNTEIMSRLLDAGVEVNATDSETGYTLVRQTVEEKAPEVLELLLRRGASANNADCKQISPLMRAANLGDTTSAKLLLQHNCMVNALDKKGRSALGRAARKGNFEMIDLLHAHGAHIFSVGESSKQNPLVHAVRSGNPAVLKKLIDQCTIKLGQEIVFETFVNLALKTAARMGSLAMVEVLLPVDGPKSFDPKRNPKPDMCVDTKNKYKTPISYALEAGHPEIALRLLEFARDRYYKGLPNIRMARSYALAIAVHKKIKNPSDFSQYQQVIDVILEEYVDPMEITLCSSAAYFAASGGDALLLKTLIEHTALQEYLEHSKDEKTIDIEVLKALELKYANKLLLFASQAGVPLAIKTLLGFGAQANVADAHGSTPLHKAVVVADENTLEMITDLCSQENNTINMCNDAGDTPLHCTMLNPNLKMRRRLIKMLLKYGANANTANEVGNTPLIAAVKMETSDRSIIRSFLKFSEPPVNLNARNKKGETALFCAAAKGHSAVAEKLIDAKACSNIKNNSGCGALTKAARKGSVEMTKLLVEGGEDIEIFKDGMLREAAKGGHIAYMKILLKKKPDLNGRSTSKGDTPLHKAVQRKQIEAVRLLLEAGADRNVKNYKGKRPLDYAMASGHDKMIDLLMD